MVWAELMNPGWGWEWRWRGGGGNGNNQPKLGRVGRVMISWANFVLYIKL